MPTLRDWSPDELPPLTGKTYLMTGGNSGVGLEAAKLLAAKDADVVITSRSNDKGEAALAEIRAAAPGAEPRLVLLDLTDPDSIEEAVKEVQELVPNVSAVVNNAGVMQTPKRRTSEGFELQFATNHLGHFRLNSALMPLLEKSAGRIVVVSSIAHKFGRIAFDDLMSEGNYDPMRAYGQSKLANLMYALELHRQLTERGSAVTAYAVHPGYAATNLQSAGVGMEGGSKAFQRFYQLGNRVMAQSAVRGAYPLVLAAADHRADPGAYYGPTGVLEMRGPVGEVPSSRRARNAADQQRLWEATESLVGDFFAK